MTHAEDVNYWKTGKSRPEVWIEKIIKELESIKAEFISNAIINSENGYFIIIRFQLESDNFCINFKALKSRTGDKLAAQIQAATLLYHDIKAKCIQIKIKGARKTFFEYFVLPNGEVASESTLPELMNQIPKILMPGNKL